MDSRLKMKICSVCKKTKQKSEFYARKASWDGLAPKCKDCDRLKKQDYVSRNLEKVRKTKKEWVEKNRDRVAKTKKDWAENNKEKSRISKKKYADNNKDKIKESRDKNKEKNKERARKNYEKRKHIISARNQQEPFRTIRNLKNKEWQKANKEVRKEQAKVRHATKMATNHLYKLRVKISKLIGISIRSKGWTKKSTTFQILGCTYEEFKVWIEDQFVEGMSWGNHGEWHLDHIVPVSYARNEEELLRLNRFDNFQPLWWLDNIKKGNRYIG